MTCAAAIPVTPRTLTSIGIDEPEVVSIYLGSKTIAGVCISSTVMYPDSTLVSEPP